MNSFAASGCTNGLCRHPSRACNPKLVPPEMVERERERRREPFDVDAHVLLAEVVLGDLVPAAPVDRIGVLDGGVVRPQRLQQRALLHRDAVLEVPEPHVGRGVAELPLRHRLQLAVGHHLDDHRPRRQERRVGEAGAVHAEQHVERVHGEGQLLDAHVEPRVRYGHLEPGLLRRLDDLRHVDELPVVAPVEQHQPRLLVFVVVHRRAALVISQADGSGARQGVGLAEEGGEIEHGERDAAGDQLRHDVELLVHVEADGDVPEAPDLVVVVEVQDLVLCQPPHDGLVLAEPPGLDVAGQELDLAAVPPRRHEQRHQRVAEVVEVVAQVAAEREHDGRDAVRDRARGRRGRHGRRVELRHRDVGDAGHVEAGVGLDAPLPALCPGRDRHQGDGVGRAVGPDIAEDIAGVGEGARSAHHLAVVCSKKRDSDLSASLIIEHFIDQVELIDMCHATE